MKVKFNPLNLTRLVSCGGVVENFEYAKAPTGFVFKFEYDYKVGLPLFQILCNDCGKTTLLTQVYSEDDDHKWVRRFTGRVDMLWKDLEYNADTGVYDLDESFNLELKSHYKKYLKEAHHLYDDSK